MQTYLIALKKLSSGEADAPTCTISSLLLETVTDYGLGIEYVAVFGSDVLVSCITVLQLD